jgi:hypothetical protein
LLRSWVTQLKECFLCTNAEEDLDNALEAMTQILVNLNTGLPTCLYYLEHTAHLVGANFLQQPSFQSCYELVTTILSVISETPAEQSDKKFRDAGYRSHTVINLLSQLGHLAGSVLEGGKDRTGVILL